MMRTLAVRHRAIPIQPLLNVLQLDQALLRHCQRFHQHRDIAQLWWDVSEITFFIHDLFRHETVTIFDAALDEISRGAEVRTIFPARQATRVRTRPTNHRHDEIADLEFLHARPDFRHDAETFVAQHEMFKTRRRVAVIEPANLAVGAADANFEDAEFYFRGR